MAALRRLAVPLIVAGLSLGVALLGPEAASALRYTRSDLAAGEWWRVITGHFVHLSWAHLGLNLAGLGVVWALVGHRLPVWAWGVGFLLDAVAVVLGLWFLSPGLEWYVGLSGCLHGLLVLGAVAALSGRDRWFGAGLLVLVAAKLTYEGIEGPSGGLEGLIRGRVVTDAHLFGAVGGLVLGGLWCIAAGRCRSWRGMGRRASLPPGG